MEVVHAAFSAVPRRAAREPHYPWTVSTGKTHIALGRGLAACQKG